MGIRVFIMVCVWICIVVVGCLFRFCGFWGLVRSIFGIISFGCVKWFERRRWVVRDIKVYKGVVYKGILRECKLVWIEVLVLF